MLPAFTMKIVDVRLFALGSLAVACARDDAIVPGDSDILFRRVYSACSRCRPRPAAPAPAPTPAPAASAWHPREVYRTARLTYGSSIRPLSPSIKRHNSARAARAQISSATTHILFRPRRFASLAPVRRSAPERALHSSRKRAPSRPPCNRTPHACAHGSWRSTVDTDAASPLLL